MEAGKVNDNEYLTTQKKLEEIARAVKRLDLDMILLACDPGRTTGWALFECEKLLAFGQFEIDDHVSDPAGELLLRFHNIFEGWDGHPAPRTRVRPTLAIVEEHSAQYHTTHKRRGVGEGALRESMKINIALRRRLEAALLRMGVPSLGITAEEWGAGENIATMARAELELAAIAIPSNFTVAAREHERDAIAMGGRCARRKVWTVR